MQCTEEEIAYFFNCSVDTIDRYCQRTYHVTFAEYSKRYRGLGKISLRRKMHEMAMDGNVPMLIWLSKQYLGHVNDFQNSIQVQVNNQTVQNKVLTTEDLRKLVHDYGYIDVTPKGENNGTTNDSLESKPLEKLSDGSQYSPSHSIQGSDSDSRTTGRGTDSTESGTTPSIRIPGYEGEG